MNKKIYNIIFLSVLLAPWLFSTQVLAQGPEMSPQFIQVAKKRISRSVYEFTFKTTLINHDTDIKNVSATVTSTSQNTVIMADNALSFNDVTANESTISLDTFILRQNRRFLFNPDDLQWNISYQTEPVLPNVKAWFDKWSSNPSIAIGKTEPLRTSINLRSSESSAISVVLTQSVSPESGISLSPHFDNTEISFDSPGYNKISQQLTAETTGQYTITTLMTEPISGITKSYIRKVTVIEQEALDVGISIGTQAYIPVGFNGFLDVGSSVVGNDYKEVTEVSLKILETGETIALPQYLNLTTHYLGHVLINTAGMVADDCLSLQIEVNSTKGKLSSPIKKVCITGFPLDLGYGPQVFIETSNGTAIALDQLIVRFREGTSEARIREILSSVGGEVVGSGSDLIFFRVGFTPVPESIEELQGKRDELKYFFEVESAELNLRLGRVNSLLPADDPLLEEGQDSIFQSRADEAWYAVRGNIPIAIVDTGIDLKGHPDLAGTVFGGKNFVAGEDKFYPHDRHGHGSHVAGIIGAQSDNAEGMTGYSWNSLLIPVKITPDKDKPFWYDVLVSGLYYAAVKAPIKPNLINASLGVAEGVIDPACEEARAACSRETVIGAICRAVTTASNNNITVVGAAGNDFKNEKTYPGACHYGLAVGAIDASDEIFTVDLGVQGSNYGDWVDIASPGENILSTETTDPDPDCDSCGTESGGLYGFRSGTSQATPAVTGALAVLFKRHPEWLNDPAKAVQRLKDTAVKHTSFTEFLGLGAGYIDLFEAVFNGSFELALEDSELPEEWQIYTDNKKPTIPSMPCLSKQEASGLI